MTLVTDVRRGKTVTVDAAVLNIGENSGDLTHFSGDTGGFNIQSNPVLPFASNELQATASDGSLYSIQSQSGLNGVVRVAVAVPDPGEQAIKDWHNATKDNYS